MNCFFTSCKYAYFQYFLPNSQVLVSKQSRVSVLMKQQDEEKKRLLLLFLFQMFDTLLH